MYDSNGVVVSTSNGVKVGEEVCDWTSLDSYVGVQGDARLFIRTIRCGRQMPATFQTNQAKKQTRQVYEWRTRNMEMCV